MPAFRRNLVLLAVAATPAWAVEPDAPEPAKPMMISEASLPAGFPAPGPVGEVIVKTYPAHRLARTAAGQDGDNRMFMRLFRHIERNEIAMTAPVTMDWSGEPAERGGPESMAFLYAEADLGEAGPDPADAAVVVEDVPEMTAVSIGLRGGYGDKTFRKGAERLDAWLAEHPEWEPAGPPRMLAYNSPFVPGILKYSEIQRPIRPAKKQDPPAAR